MNIKLRDYQKEWCRAVHTAFEHGVDGLRFSRILATMATGGGKTASASALMWERIAKQSQKCLFLANTDELCLQANRAIHTHTGFIPAIEKASERAALAAKVVVGSVQTIAMEKRMTRFPQDHFGLVIADEAHLAMADGFKGVLEYFNQGGADILGITATPERGDKFSLMKFFEHVAAEVPMKLLIDRGYLSPITVQTAPIQIPVKSKVTDSDSQKVADEIAPYYESIIDGIEKYAKERKKILIFHPTVKASKAFTEMLIQRGHTARHIDGTSKDREEIIQGFEQGNFRILNNVMLLTTGVDIPAIDCVIMLRPVGSRTLYIQAVGRGTRLYCPEGCHRTGSMCTHEIRKKDVLLLDFLWQFSSKNVMGPADIFTHDPAQKEAIDEHLKESDKPFDLLQLDRDTVDEREQRIIRMLREAAQRAAQRFDARSFAAVFHQPELLQYEPQAEWEKEALTDKQKELFASWGIKQKGLTRGHASRIHHIVFNRRAKQLATPKQVLQLLRFGVEEPHTMTRQEAGAFLDIHLASATEPKQ